MDSFEVYFEKNFNPLPLTLGTVAYATGIFIPEDCWQNFINFPPLFSDKLNIVCRGLDDQRKRDVNKQLIERCISLAAAFIGYGKSGQGYKMPKTKVICDYRGLNSYTVVVNVGDDVDGYEYELNLLAKDEEAAAKMGREYGEIVSITPDEIQAIAQHAHYRKRSWSHEIELFFGKFVEGDDDDFNTLMGNVIHEMIHAKQTTTRKLSTSHASGDYKWDGKLYKDPLSSHEEYMNAPWEKEAYGSTPEILGDILSFLRTGAVKGFNPKRV